MEDELNQLKDQNEIINNNFKQKEIEMTNKDNKTNEIIRKLNDQIIKNDLELLNLKNKNQELININMDIEKLDKEKLKTNKDTNEIQNNLNDLKKL